MHKCVICCSVIYLFFVLLLNITIFFICKSVIYNFEFTSLLSLKLPEVIRFALTVKIAFQLCYLALSGSSLACVEMIYDVLVLRLSFPWPVVLLLLLLPLVPTLTADSGPEKSNKHLSNSECH